MTGEMQEDKPRSLVGAVVVLEAIAPGQLLPGYEVYGTTDCQECDTGLWVGMRTKHAIFSGALPMCQACAAVLLNNPAATQDPEKFVDE